MAEKKSKLRFTSFDLAAAVSELAENLPGLRLKNFYDLSPNTYLFKFIRNEERRSLLVEVGVRLHLTETQVDKDKMPSAFAMKFRKSLRGRRLESVKQVGMERVSILEFIGEGGLKVHVIMEFYSQGNLILADHEFRVIALTRSHVYDEEHRTAVGELYPFQAAAKIYLSEIKLSVEVIQALLREEGQPEKKRPKKLTLTSLVQKAVPCLFQQLIESQLEQEGLNPGADARESPV
jgi:predicted ribosome quality control (RQC) complex YloA/Tae2 family protein